MAKHDIQLTMTLRGINGKTFDSASKTLVKKLRTIHEVDAFFGPRVGFEVNEITDVSIQRVEDQTIGKGPTG